jgi:HlyD family secretion protein
VKKLLVLLVLICVVLAGGAYWLKHAQSGSADEGFTFARVEFGSMTEAVSTTGTVQPREVVLVGSELSGAVVYIYPGAEVGKEVLEGQPLIELEKKPALIKLTQAKTSKELAEKSVSMATARSDAAELKAKKLRDLVQKAVGQQRDLDEAEMELKAAKAAVGVAQAKIQEAQDAVDAAQYGLDLTTVRAGRGIKDQTSSAKKHYWIIKREVYLGQLVAPPASAQLFRLASDLAQMQVHALVSENDIGKMRPGLEASFTVYAYPEEHFSGKVGNLGLSDTTIHGAVSYDTVIDVVNRRDPKTQEWMLRPGMTAAVDVILREHADVWKMPTAALSFQLDEHYQTEASKAKLARWQTRPDQGQWKVVWIMDDQGKPWPILVRLGGKNAAGETGIDDTDFSEVLEWDPELAVKPSPNEQTTYPHVITGAPPARKGSLFDRPPSVKVL